jgi:hypothetical protein
MKRGGGAGNRSQPDDVTAQTHVDSSAGEPPPVDLSARSVVDVGPSEMRDASTRPGTPNAVEDALARALSLAAQAQRWDVVSQLARELEARRLVSAGVADLAARRKGGER